MKKLKLLIICPIIVSMLVSCTKGGDITTESASDKSISGTPAAEESTNTDGVNHMSIYFDLDDRYMRSAVNEYNDKNKDIPIVINEFDYGTQLEETKEKLATELMAGEGPDLILTFSELFPSLRKTFDTGVFYDLNKVIEEDVEFRLSDYNQTIFDSCVVNGRRYVLPISYYVPSFWTSKSILDKNNINVNVTKWTWKDFFIEAKKYMNKHKEGDKYFTGLYFEPVYIMNYICGELVDYKSKKTGFNTLEFINFLKDYKAVSKFICPSEKMASGEIYNYLKSDSIVLINAGVGRISPLDIFNMNTAMQYAIGENSYFFKFPSLDARQLKSANVLARIGINENSKYKKEAFEFIKILLSEEYQSRSDLRGIPVNKNAYAKEVNNYSGDNVKSWKGAGSYYLPEPVNGFPVPPQVAQNVEEIINSVNNCNIIDYSIIEIATAEVDEYLKGSRSAEATAKAIDDKVMLYMNE